MNGVMPPGGVAGFAQMTPASRLSLFPPGRSTASRGGRSRKRKSARRKTSRTSTMRAKSHSRKLKFGSPAWQRKYKVGKFAKKR